MTLLVFLLHEYSNQQMRLKNMEAGKWVKVTPLHTWAHVSNKGDASGH